MRLAILSVGFVLALSQVPASAQQARTTVFVGAEIREGFFDIDSGIRDSIRDIRSECRSHSQFALVEDRKKATIVLIVVARGVVVKGSIGWSSSSGSSIGGLGSSSGSGYVMPNSVPTLTTSLRVRDYERTMQSEGSTWGNAASKVVEDLLAWLDANQDAVRALH